MVNAGLLYFPQLLFRILCSMGLEEETDVKVLAVDLDLSLTNSLLRALYAVLGNHSGV